jgi:hypothetical protein
MSSDLLSSSGVTSPRRTDRPPLGAGATDVWVGVFAADLFCERRDRIVVTLMHAAFRGPEFDGGLVQPLSASAIAELCNI